MADSQFNGFPKQGLGFLTDLQSNNQRDWFNAHKSVYTTHLNQPSKAFCVALQDRLPELTGQTMNSKLFRIYRDVRFSKDKTPYNTHVRASFFCDDKSQAACGVHPAFHFSLEPDHLIIGVGSILFPKAQLEGYRAAVVDDAQGTELAQIVGGYTSEEDYYLDAPELKRVPAGYDKAHPRAELLKRKGLVQWQGLAHTEVLHSAALIDQLMDGFRKLQPVYGWLAKIQTR